jgi:hypothetical protein
MKSASMTGMTRFIPCGRLALVGQSERVKRRFLLSGDWRAEQKAA